MHESDLSHLRAALRVAQAAREHGNHPFGALLVDRQGALLLEAENSVVTERDATGHAELNLVRAASRRFEPAVLAGCTLYTSTEPCAMCAGAIYWAAIPRVVFALSEQRLIELARPNPANDLLFLPCRELFARGRHPVEVLGPLLEDEAALVHAGFWA